ncbi:MULTISPECIES: phasin family protein [Ferrimonas]|uniref:Poly(Hydroxyalkanoate) granule-associated protein n=1 Tax=Ferrimonas sediminum TaxID=718193 RepID=A0A1G8W2I8_9GAMM|nr:MULTISPECIES: phasin family protein [Ferrimonas]USD39514.1 phasin family protein [Ferrimonas sp. SCSIO 43195]SDJ72528.1 poly(hydroxyalkanoate) granule-associated protein [Ferrimonas sediminum]
MNNELHGIPPVEGVDNEQLARNIWLAGLGVYSRSVEEAKDLEGKSSDLFERLVERGREIESNTKQRVEDNLDRANEEVEARVHNLFYRLSGIHPRQIDELNAKVDKLAEAIEKLAK